MLGLILTALCLVGACASSRSATPHEDAEVTADSISNAPDNPFPCENPVPSQEAGAFDCDNDLTIYPRPLPCRAAAQELDECRSNQDCGEGLHCACSTPNICYRPGEVFGCQSDLDCAPGFHCALAPLGWSDWVTYTRRCQQPTDECASAADCLPDGADLTDQWLGISCQGDEAGRYCCERGVGCSDER